MRYYPNCPQLTGDCTAAGFLFTQLLKAQDEDGTAQVLGLVGKIEGIYPKCPHIAADKADALLRSGDQHAAIGVVDDLLTSGIRNSLILGLKARIVRRSDGPKAALPWFRKAWRKEPTAHLRNCNLAIILLELNRGAEALPYARNAQETEPDEDLAAAWLCSALAQVGQRDEFAARARQAAHKNGLTQT